MGTQSTWGGGLTADPRSVFDVANMFAHNLLFSWRSASNTISRNQLSAFLETQANLTLHRATRKKKDTRYTTHYHPHSSTFLFRFSAWCGFHARATSRFLCRSSSGAG